MRHENLKITVNLQLHHQLSSAWQPQREAEMAVHAFSFFNF